MSSDQNDEVEPRGEDGRFKKGISGNPRGRPPKQPFLLVSSQLRRTLLSILDEKMGAPTPNPQDMTKFEAIMRNLVIGAANGKPTPLNHLMRLLPSALEERLDEHKPVMIAEYLRTELDKPISDIPYLRQQTNVHIKAVRFHY